MARTTFRGPDHYKFLNQMKTTDKLPKRNNAVSGTKAHHDNQMHKVGRIRMNSWANKLLSAYDIIIYDSELVHIYKRHGNELRNIGMNAFDFVKFIVSNFNEIYKDNDRGYLLVVHRTHTSNMAAIALHLVVSNGKEVYKINTATPVKTKQLQSKRLLCANDH